MIIALDDVCRIVEEVVDNLPIRPRSVLVEQCKRCVPVEKNRRNLELLLHQLGNDIVVMLDAFFVDWTLAEWENARPGDGETEGRYTQVLQTSKVLLV